MNFEQDLQVQAVDINDNSPIANVALVLVLKSSSKNDYFVGPKITDSSGELRFTKQDCIDAITNAQKMFVMDYSGDLTSCAPSVTLQLHPPQNIEGMLKQFANAPEFWGQAFEQPKELFEALKQVENIHYESAQIVITENELAQKPARTLHLERCL